MRATLRLQFHRGFTLRDALDQVPYFAALGVSHLYASPLLASQPGSTHGYDGIAHDRIDPELGGEPALRELVAALRGHGMGLLLDIVPNHMAASLDNPWWVDVLELGRGSDYADWFDIDWEAGGGRLLLPWLPAPLPDLVADADLSLRWDPGSGRIHVHAGTVRVPLGACSYGEVLAGASAQLDPLARAFAPDADRAAFDTARTALRRAAETHPTLHSAVDAALERWLPVDAAAQARLRAVLDAQPWRLADWRVAPQRINWRRFFDIGALVALRVDRPQVFDAVHAYPLALFAQGLVDGLRIDHVDGLRDPPGYCRRLRAELDGRLPLRPPDAPARGWLLVEKILAADEPLRPDWGVDGSTGYEFMDRVGALLHDATGCAALDRAWRAAGGAEPFAALALAARREILEGSFAADFERALARIGPLLPVGCEPGQLARALRALLVHLPVYRTYISGERCDTLDREVLQGCAAAARSELDAATAPVLEQLLQALCDGAGQDAELREEGLAAFQQLSPPIAAKSIEDTAFYRYGRLLSRNEVGADPGELALPAGGFHDFCQSRARLWPRSMLSTATHDHKRGEDARARLAVLSECADWWTGRQEAWLARRPEGLEAHAPLPDPQDRAMALQALLGAWPATLAPEDSDGIAALRERLAGWQRKALREAKRRSSWSRPDTRYEAACAGWLAALLADAEVRADVHAAVRQVAAAGALNGLVQALLRMSAPGVPDLYQGCEWWDHSLVDPDNRRAVDYAARAAALQDQASDASLLQCWADGRIKQRLVQRVLAARAARPQLFGEGDYVPLPVHGAQAERALAFLRSGSEGHALVVVPLHAFPLLGPGAPLPRVPPAAWEHTSVQLPAGAPRAWQDALGGGSVELHDDRLPLARVLHDWPVALLLDTRA